MWAEWNDNVLPFPEPLERPADMVELLYEFLPRPTYEEWWWREHNIRIRLDPNAQPPPNWWGRLVGVHLYF